MIVKLARKHSPKAEMNVVPYIDVMLVLLVIFMVTAPLLVQGVTLELPKVEAEVLPVDSNPQIVTLSVQVDGGFYWNVGPELDVSQRSDQATDMAQMREHISAIVAAREDTQVFVRADKGADYGRVVSAIAALQQGGVTKLGLITEAP